MITAQDGVFHIRTGALSYLFRVTAHGHLEHLHFGGPVADGDAPALACAPGLGWGTAVLYDEEDPAYCLDWLPLEWSGAGCGDYRESPVALETPQGPAATDFRYKSHAVTRGCAPMEGGLPQAHGGAETLAVTLEDDALHARLTLYWTAFETALTRRAVLENTGDAPLYVTRLMSWCADLPGALRMTTFDGGWISETHRSDAPVGPARVVNESVTGFSSHRHNPGFLLSETDAQEDAGRVWGFNLLYSGNHYAAAQRSAQGLTRVVQGISPDHFRRALAPGGRFETPEAVLAFSDGGFNGLSAAMHAFINGHVVPDYWRGRERPVLFNSWEGCMFDFTEARLLELGKKAKKLGCELFVLDDGWFGARASATTPSTAKSCPAGSTGSRRSSGRWASASGCGSSRRRSTPTASCTARIPTGR
ncbi:MAG: glycoside hydrolase family 36 N-terminal domain-containing protein [Oscillospiraceae bacterium]|nr:glycoside hydrolase family 36 N-terminal domain-containing protein [Oscillospiraceae bacterium]